MGVEIKEKSNAAATSHAAALGPLFPHSKTTTTKAKQKHKVDLK